MFNIHEDAKKYEEYVIACARNSTGIRNCPTRKSGPADASAKSSDKMGIPYTRVAGTNVVGLIDTGRPARHRLPW